MPDHLTGQAFYVTIPCAYCGKKLSTIAVATATKYGVPVIDLKHLAEKREWYCKDCKCWTHTWKLDATFGTYKGWTNL